MSKENTKDALSFHVQLLSSLLDINRYPFTKLVIEKNVTYEEYSEIFQLLEHLDEKFRVQKEEGLLDFTSLLVQFAGLLTDKLNPNETIYALKKEGYFPSLMNEFIQIIKNYK